MTLYRDPIVTAYTTLITDNNSQFKGIYQGDPIMIPSSFLPALIVSKTDTQVSRLTNKDDHHQIRMAITVVTDIRQEINDDTQVVPGVAKLYELVEGRTEGTYLLQSTSILDILRMNEVVDEDKGLITDLETITTVSYAPVVGKRNPDSYSVEAQITFTAHFIQLRP